MDFEKIAGRLNRHARRAGNLRTVKLAVKTADGVRRVRRVSAVPGHFGAGFRPNSVD